MSHSSAFRTCVWAILLYDVNRRKSFEGAGYWIKDIEWTIPSECFKILYSNKVDQFGKRKVSTEEGNKLAEEHDMFLMEISIVDEINVNEFWICSECGKMRYVKEKISKEVE